MASEKDLEAPVDLMKKIGTSRSMADYSVLCASRIISGNCLVFLVAVVILFIVLLLLVVVAIVVVVLQFSLMLLVMCPH